MEQGGGGGGGEVVEEASPISSRPPANFEELMRFSAAAEDGGGGVSGGGSSSSGNRWPREETLALLRIRSDMDSIFRDATLKAPLWEDVSRKLSEFGYKRSAKKCKEKFENVQKYYKRTKESRGGRQHGKAYKFFSQLEALNTTAGTSNAAAAATATKVSTLDVAPLSVANPILTPFSTSAAGVPSSSPFSVFPPPPPASFASIPITPTPPPASANITAAGVSFSSHSSSTASGMGSDDDDDDDDEMDVDVANVAGPSSRKRKRGHRQGGKMMEFFEGLVKQVLQKQAAMQRSFLDALEKTEQERTGREEAWRRQEMARLAREHELMAQDRAASASRDAAILSLIQKITGQSIQLPPPSATPPQPPPPPPPPPAPPLQKIQHTHHHRQRSHKAAETSNIQSQSQPIMAIPQQQIPPRPPPQQQQPEKQHDQMVGGSGSSEPASSRWPKAEVLALINLRSGLEPQYQEAGPKGPLWEEISAAMQRMGYCRSAKRCKEKWENINKYYKKVKEGNKKRPEDAKTCPYFHHLDTLYRNKVLGGSSTSGLQLHRPDQDQILTPKESAEASPEGVNVQPLGSASSSGDRNQEHMEKRPEEGAFREGGETEKKTL
ncbi:PREDICTED: trihelix transcription factor GTL1 isoform X2 [Tarenaya hassleriana]|uniref:trihelix transcription factor GTL1 isoform X2 n=1 Tax=Tarenaya hassleriana TaxID=28532 RepID=UPI00053C2C5D|nr:PREDICTED: trihelix transcription factor GTL1 isoform X2 [Tarenaya hassleriana]